MSQTNAMVELRVGRVIPTVHVEKKAQALIVGVASLLARGKTQLARPETNGWISGKGRRKA